MVRLKDIAERAGVSVMTVSKVLRDAHDVSAATKVRIRALAQEMGYVPDAMAQSLRTRNTHLLGLVIPAVTNPIFARLILAVEARAAEVGYDLLLGHSLNRPEREETLIRRLISRRVQGILLFPVPRMGPPTPVFAELLRHGTPTVILGPPPPGCPEFPFVQADDVQGGYLAARHLLELGHRRIAFLAGPAAAGWSQERFEGYRRALREWAIEVDDSLVFAAGSTIEEGEKAALQMLQEHTGATGIQAANDLVAIGAGNALLNQGLAIPGDLSLIGFGNVLTSAYFRVPLTTIRQPKHSMGLAGIDMLEALIRGERPESRRLPTSLLVRQSTAAPPTRATPHESPAPGDAGADHDDY